MSLTSFVLENALELREAIVRRNVRDVVAGKIAALIASGILKLGDDLPSERDLAAALQVSRETVRSGIQMLAARGLLVVTQGARTKVASDSVGQDFVGLRESKLINSYDIESIHASRLLVERQVVASAAERIDAETLRFLEDSLKAQRHAAADPVRFLIIDREFHVTIYRCSGNKVLADFVADLYGYMMEHRRKAVAEPGAILRSYGDHQAIVAALRAKDPEATTRAFDVHLDRIYRTTMSILAHAGAKSRGRAA
ncbi:FCD domain-containing protein [Aurantimonas sp. C2-6-R+9]|uniref:FadR/GntR family transcriptional regulator n=1 Tax=unclassified Aurantimonas TaxID=2638230 RepID=UPI002E16E2C0|nr:MULTISPECIES: FCD domain-containing protein [unclassified Aurantimonas]MEC5292268.1 FCD domain-containing protein [Aurantimonas sp. C2-3-R2]MEC5382483.1 FCD domain-containing protein [Aurantimonas sp. C2-6-R+9]MEC5413353.1 FCD domain-containing protein [Aurantimonas sp. C2-4-R8]